MRNTMARRAEDLKIDECIITNYLELVINIHGDLFKVCVASEALQFKNTMSYFKMKLNCTYKLSKNLRYHITCNCHKCSKKLGNRSSDL